MTPIDRTEDGATQERPARRASDPNRPVRLRFVSTRQGELTLLVFVGLAGALMAFGAAILGSASWLHQVCAWLGIVSVLLFVVLLAGSLFRPHAVTERRVRALGGVMTGIACLAILCGVLGFLA